MTVEYGITPLGHSFVELVDPLRQWAIDNFDEVQRARQAEHPAPTDRPAAKRAARPMRIEIGCKGGRVLKVEANIAPDILKALIRSVEDA